MAEGKRYYWLKLKDDFFSSKRIKKLRKMAGGDTYLIIYLKLQLKAMKTDGTIKFDGVEQTIAEELALDLDEEIDNVKVTLGYLVGCGLAETNAEASYLFFPYAVENVGSEGSSALRMRELRDRQKKLSQSDAGVTRALQSGDGEKEIEKEIDIEIDREIDGGRTKVITTVEDRETATADELVKYAASELQYISRDDMEELTSYRDSMTDDMIRYAINETVRNGSRKYAYCRRILQRITERGYKTLGEVKAAEEERIRKRDSGKASQDARPRGYQEEPKRLGQTIL